ncbi:MAG: hypothetical protein COW56_05270 [Rhodocyclales bacterium CG17_big_fil_post_rev_8_21_14_2_50_68_7]|nr:MAG: hypothetical protein AUK49_00765 [Betaproteobacteria bacterium CG2_30_68_42]PIV74249.1 MAG: hypothetical protein COW56_05270 [Rhodocyclales bacterium CG17_big_fil_post_rev_8_21_14_2_50_68_7]PJA58482.1 MAG: hypothetical protein CO164_02280 [Rhodocyclales bacterium CG_4_9_14_3_um_filter_68_10]
MKTRNIVLGGALALAVLATWWVSREPPGRAGVADSARAAHFGPAPAGALPAELFAGLHAERLTSEPRGTPFGVPVPPPAAPAVRPADPGPPPFPYAFLGRVDVPGERTRAVLSHGAELKEIREGDPVDAVFVLKGVGDTGLLIEHRPDGRTWVVPFGAPGIVSAPGRTVAPVSVAGGAARSAIATAVADAPVPTSSSVAEGTPAAMSIEIAGRETPMESAPPVGGRAMESSPPVPGQRMGAFAPPLTLMPGLPAPSRTRGF